MSSSKTSASVADNVNEGVCCEVLNAEIMETSSGGTCFKGGATESRTAAGGDVLLLDCRERGDSCCWEGRGG